ncbi:MAG: cardiolipin synthase B [Actinobacteria bacterium]|nr:cardiolipin synthase B [Actinomycetota bacterium]
MARDPHDFRRALEALMGIRASDGNAVEVLRNGERIFPAMLDAIRSAERTIDFMTYVYWGGAPAEWFAEAFAERARDGLRVRVLVDAIGARLMDDELVQRMTEAGVLFERFRPVGDLKLRASHRTHRRVLLLDGAVGFTGGVGIAEEWLGDARTEHEWRETHVRVEGPAADGLRAAFLENWAETPHPILDRDEQYPAPEHAGDVAAMVVRSSAGHGVSRMSILKRLLIDLAEERVDITSAYLAPDEGAIQAITDACVRGVQVRILVPGAHVDKRVAGLAAQEHFEELMTAGARMFTYERSMLHAKTMVVDGVVADVGSANFNSRSLSQDEEVDLVMFSPEVAGILDEHFAADLELSEEITEERWKRRPALQRFAEGVVGLVDDVM